MSVHRFSVLTTVYSGSDPDLLVLSLTSAKIAISNASPHSGTHRVYVDGPVPDDIETVLTHFATDAAVMRGEVQQGPSHGLNRMLEMCKGDDIVFIQDGDDFSLPQRFRQSLLFFDAHPDVDLLGAQAIEFHIESDRIKALSYPTSHSSILSTLSRRAPFAHSSVGYRRSRLGDALRYDESMRNTIDLEIHSRLLLDGVLARNQPVIHTVLLFDGNFYRRRSGDKWPNEWRLYRMIQNKTGHRSDLLFLLLRGVVRYCPPHVHKLIYRLR